VDDEAAAIVYAAKTRGDKVTVHRSRRVQSILLGTGRSRFLEALALVED
jgi:hypothetical protein